MPMVLAFSLLFKRPRAETREKIGIGRRVGRDEAKKSKGHNVENLTVVLAFWPCLMTLERAKNTTC